MKKLPHYVQITENTEYGDSKMFRIRLNPKYKDDEGLMIHEYTHVTQWYFSLAMGLSLMLMIYMITGREDYTFYALCAAPLWKGVLYTFVKPVRLYLEVQAFAAQISIQPLRHYEYYIEEYGKIIATKYNLNITPGRASFLLSHQLSKILK